MEEIMLKLMKYELRKQAFSKLIILAIALLGEIMFFTGFIMDKSETIGLALGLLSLFTVGALFFIAFESIMTFQSDLKQKHSYMLFLTPNTTYSIIGAKVISSALQIMLSGLAFALLFIMDGAVLLAKYSSLNEINRALKEFVNLQFNINLDYKYLVLVILVILVTWITIITLSYLSITLSATFLADKRGKSFISFVIFFIMIISIGKLEDFLLFALGINAINDTSLIVGILFHVVVTIIAYITTAWMLDKKVSV
jgi:hypothetical protein